MDLIGIGAKAVLSVLFLIIAAWAFVLGDQEGAKENERAPFISLYQPFVTDELRQEITAELNRDSRAEQYEAVRKLSKLAQVDVLPFEVALAQSIAQGDRAQANTFADLALRRQPRSIASRLHKFGVAAQQDRYDDVILQYERLIHIGALDSELLASALIGVFEATDDWSVLTQHLRTNPSKGRPLVQRLLTQSIPLDQLMPILELYPNLQEEYFQHLIENDENDSARSVWRSLYGFESEESLSVPFNGSFEIRNEPPPFNWTLQPRRSELVADGGLLVTYLGRGRPLFVEQLLNAQPGEYALKMSARGLIEPNAGELEWLVICQPLDETIARFPFGLSDINLPKMFEFELRVPKQDCAFQRLELRARAGTRPKVSRAEILSVELVPFSG